MDSVSATAPTAVVRAPSDVANAIREVAAQYTRGEQVERTNGLRKLRFQDMQFFAVHKDHQDKLVFEAVREALLSKSDLSPETKIMQVIGDSGLFSAEGTHVAATFLERHLAKEEYLILWGYTGSEQEDSCETNQLVTRWLESQPSRWRRAVANVVDFHTPIAIEEWGCAVSGQIQTLYLVAGDAKFGDDAISSDALPDYTICLEGGPQSFHQIVNLLSRDGVELQILFHLRHGAGHNQTPVPSGAGSEEEMMTFFSAGEFLFLLNERIREGESEATSLRQVVEDFKREYLSEHHLFNPYKPDAGTKTALFEAAWAQFMESELWTRLDRCHFTEATYSEGEA